LTGRDSKEKILILSSGMKIKNNNLFWFA